MAKKTIAQLREMEVIKLAKFRSKAPTEADINEARRIMNSFYRLCGLCTTNLYLTNDSYWHNKPSTEASEAKEERWIKRLNQELKPYGLQLFFSGYCPSIGIVDNRGCVYEKINRWFYD